jgi:small subunit ribosomal protein S7
VVRAAPAHYRAFSDSKDSPKVDPNNADTLPHVSEEAAKTAEIMGEQGPQVEQGTPVEEVR